MNDVSRPPAALGPVLIQLMKGVLYRDSQARLWQDMLALEAAARDYLAVLGLALDIDDGEGYAFLRQAEPLEGADAMPRLITRRPLSYPVSLLLRNTARAEGVRGRAMAGGFRCETANLPRSCA